MRSLATLLPKLMKATETGKLSWDKRRPFSGYTTKLDDYTIQTWEWSDDSSPENSGVSLRLTDEKDAVIDEMVVDEYSSGYQQLRELFLAARRSALKVDAVIAGLESKLEGL